MTDVDYGMGCRPSPIDLRDFKLKRQTVKAYNFPDRYEISLHSNVKNQSTICSCVAHATSTILEHHDKGRTKLSTNFIYGIHHSLYGSNGPGMFIREACDIVTRYGDCTLEDCPGNTEIETVYKLAEEAFNDKDKLTTAYKYKTKKYVKLRSEADIKFALLNYGPVLVSIKWYKQFNVSPADHSIHFNYSSDQGYHAIVIYGWNENGWLFQNSWGRTFGYQGKAVLPYDHGIVEAYGLIDDETLGGDTEIVNPTYNNDLLTFLFKAANKVINFFMGIFCR